MAHGQDHLADVFCLRFFLVFKGNHADLGDAVNNIGYILAKIFIQLFNGGLGVLHRVVQKTGGHRGFVKSHLSQGIGHGQRMGQIGLAGKARLSHMSGSGKYVGLLDKL